jgi:outer membrane assembly lipoprotein YfiO
VWTPYTGWIGPSGAVKDTPQEQLAYAVSFFQQQDYDKAKIELKKLLKQFKDSREAAEAQYYLGRCEEEKRDYYAAFLAYKKTAQVYPSTSRFEEILERIYQIGNYFLGGKKRMIFGAVAIMPARDKAIEAFQAIVEEGPFSEHGELAQYKLGIAYLALGEYEQAVSAFDQLIDRYPKSPLVDDARFQLAQASLKGTFKAAYDQHPTQQAVEELHTFVEEYPDSDLSPEAVARIQTLRERQAEHEFQAAQFYERRKQAASAVVYYQEIVSRYADTVGAPKAAERLEALAPKTP